MRQTGSMKVSIYCPILLDRSPSLLSTCQHFPASRQDFLSNIVLRTAAMAQHCRKIDDGKLSANPSSIEDSTALGRWSVESVEDLYGKGKLGGMYKYGMLHRSILSYPLQLPCARGEQRLIFHCFNGSEAWLVCLGCETGTSRGSSKLL